MKYAFIVNPNSGHGKKAKGFIAKINEIIEKNPDVSLHITEGPMDATIIAEGLADVAKKTSVDTRIFACGGDGTLNEVLNGIYDRPHVELGVVPIGSGNDFVRNFASCNFEDINAQLNGNPIPIDLLKIEYEEDGKEKTRYCINGINIGFDGNTAILSNHLKKKKFFRGHLSYIAAIIMNIAEMRGQNLRIRDQDNIVHAGELLLITLSNGRFCGGGIESCPKALVDDGLMEVLIVNKVSRKTFFRLMPSYIKGELLEKDISEDIYKYLRSDKITMEPIGGIMQFAVDGEEMKSGKTVIEIVQNGVKFVLPDSK